MSIIGFIFQLVFIYIIIRVLWAVFGAKRPRRSNDRSAPENAKPKRFNTSGKDVADAKFEDIKEKD
jgi:hypothetical protein